MKTLSKIQTWIKEIQISHNNWIKASLIEVRVAHSFQWIKLIAHSCKKWDTKLEWTCLRKLTWKKTGKKAHLIFRQILISMMKLLANKLLKKIIPINRIYIKIIDTYPVKKIRMTNQECFYLVVRIYTTQWTLFFQNKLNSTIKVRNKLKKSHWIWKL